MDLDKDSHEQGEWREEDEEQEEDEEAKEDKSEVSTDGALDEQDLKQYGIYQSLPVEGEPDFAAGSPQTAEEYLRRVRYEAARLPKVVTSAIDPRRFDDQRTQYVPPNHAVVPCPDWARPSVRWVREFLADFGAVRDRLQSAEEAGVSAVHMPAGSGDEAAWKAFCLGRLPQPGLPAAPASDETGAPHPPSLPLILSLDQVMAARLLRWHIRWVQAAGDALPEQGCRWLYCLAARLETPVGGEVGAALRSLLSHCARLRSRAADGADASLPNLNVLIAIAGAFFRQDEELAALYDG